MADNTQQRRLTRRRLLQAIGGLDLDLNDFNLTAWYWDVENGTPDATRSLAPVAAALGLAVECLLSLNWLGGATADLVRLNQLANARGFWQIADLTGVQRQRARLRVILDYLVEQGT